MSDPITRLNAALEGRYRIERELGAGGMATVYLADDLKHERKVALKVLKPELAAVVGAERFLAEIKTTANLQHPHILPLFDSGEADSFLFYVMPYVEGETLRDRLDRDHQLPVDEAVRIASDVAEALAYAHGHGVIHRDIKPANILIHSGRPVLSDFGIALAVGAAGGGRLTETGLSLGTPHYMSPEQATGDLSVGAATDVYALGCVLYEMLVGEPPHTGSTAQAILGKIIAGETATATKHRASVPANVDAAIRKALEKLPADRFASAQEFAKALADPGFRHGELSTVGAAAARQWNRLTVATTIAAGVFALTTGWSLLRPEPPASVARFPAPFLASEAPIGAMELTPDGSALVYTGPGPSTTSSQLWIRRWENLEATPIPGTEFARPDGVAQLSLSPDLREVAFTFGTTTEARVEPIQGGPGRTVVEGASAVGGWSVDGWIYFHSGGTGIQRVPENGGEAEVLTELTDGETLHLLPHLLPGDRMVVFEVVRAGDGSDAELWSLDVETRERKVLIPGSSPRYAATGHLLFGTPNGTLMAAPFDARRAELKGPAVPVAEGLSTDALRGQVTYSVSQTGTLVYRAGETQGGFEFVWVSRSGQATPVHPGHTFNTNTANRGWRLSADETRVVFNSQVDGVEDIRIKHLPDGPEERITFTQDLDFRPFWSPDGQSVTYFSGPDAENRNVWSMRADGTGEPTLILDDERSFTQGAWSPDGEWLVLRAGATAAMGLGLRDILTFRPGVDSVAVPLVGTPEFFEGAPEVSPDGRWLAYTSNETGREEVFVRPFPEVNSGRVRVSANGGIGPLWAKSGRELFYMDQARGLVAAQFDPASGQVLLQETLFTIPDGYEAGSGGNFYDVSGDGERFLMARLFQEAAGDGDTPSLILVLNFFEELKRLVPN